MSDETVLKDNFEKAVDQRFIALRNAFLTLDAFVIPSVNPDMLDNYLKLKDYLIDAYKPEREVKLFFPEEPGGDLYNKYEKYIKKGIV